MNEAMCVLYTILPNLFCDDAQHVLYLTVPVILDTEPFSLSELSCSLFSGYSLPWGQMLTQDWLDGGDNSEYLTAPSALLLVVML